MLASGCRLGGFRVGFASVDVLLPPKFPAPTTKVLNWLKQTFSLFSSKLSTATEIFYVKIVVTPKDHQVLNLDRWAKYLLTNSSKMKGSFIFV